jgi:anti-anti-sigma factor
MTDPVVVDSYHFDAGSVIALAGELDACTCRGMAERLGGSPGSLIVVDLARLTFIDSSGLGLIHEARRKAIHGGGNLVVCNPHPVVLRVLEITGLDTWVVDWDPAWSKGAGAGCAAPVAPATPAMPGASRSDSLG